MPTFLSRFTRAVTAMQARLIALLVAFHGLLIITDTLVEQLGAGHRARHFPFVTITIDIPLFAGFLLLYLSLSLRGRKQRAWQLAVGIYIFLLGLNANVFLAGPRLSAHGLHVATMLLPVAMLAVLWSARREFVVLSDTRTFMNSLKITVLVLLVAFSYGTAGFALMDTRDFHQEITLLSAMHYTADQFDLTTNPLHAYTRRAVLFQESLTLASISAVGLALVSLFQPLRARYTHQKEWYERAHQLIYTHPHDSEDFFKLWPHDKAYFFSSDGRAGVAYKVQRGVALVVGDPFGDVTAIDQLLQEFEDLCFGNGWRPAFVHVTTSRKELFTAHGYQLQSIGQEALVPIEPFTKETINSKYFREIDRRFSKRGYTVEVLRSPHHAAVLERLQVISQEWLERPGRAERRFMMGYFSNEYMQQCEIIVARDAAGTIQAFLNMLPSSLPEEADYDLLRNSKYAPGNINDYLLMHAIQHLRHVTEVKRLNMGLCPLAGLEQEPTTLINRTLRFVYANGDRFYSFRGLYKFKAKYAPEWSERYIAYKGGVTEFTRVMTALNNAMKV